MSSGPTKHYGRRWRGPALHVLFAASGAAGLIYQVLWLRAFGNLFGATAEAAAATLAAFFLGIALGSDFFGRRADATERPLRLYGKLELGIAAAALPVLPALALYRWAYPELYGIFGDLPGVFTAVKASLAALLLLPATAFMGGTLPAIGRALAGDVPGLARPGGRLYAANIAGAVLGALLATFGLPIWLGVRGSYALAIGINLLVAACAWWLSRRESPLPVVRQPATEPERRSASSRRLLAIAFGSGLASIALELLWTRMLALVLQNSVYSFGVIVAVFLVALAVAAAVVSRLAARFDVWRLVRLSLLLTGVLVLLTPLEFDLLTDGLRIYGASGGWLSYTLSILGLASAVMLPPIIAAGMVLPCIWELWRERPGSGIRFGRPTAVNTLGAIAGPLLAGFVALPTIGLGAAIGVIGLLYLLMGAVVTPRARRPRFGGWEAAVVYPAAVAIFIFAPPTSLPVVRLDPGERLLWAEEGSRGAVAVVQKGRDRRIKLDNHYALGGTAVHVEERRQGHLPLLLHGTARRVAVIGLGTGISAGAVLDHSDVERVVVMELVPEIAHAARARFQEWNGDLMEDPRVQVVIEDGRNHLAGTSETFDVIIGDLFVPWRAGVGSLYSREHFENVRERLRSGGIFAQWLPLWQMSRREFDIIATTFLSVFDHVMIWRGVFSPSGPSVALLALGDAQPVRTAALEERLERLQDRNPVRDGFLSELTGFMVLYAGELSGRSELLGDAAINSDNRPRIEWLAPRTQRAVVAGAEEWFTGAALADFYEKLNRSMGRSGDQLVSTHDLSPWRYRVAGALFYRAEVAAAKGAASRAQALRNRAFGLLAGRDPAP